MIDIENKHIVVIGAARSGVAAARLLKRKKASVFVSDYHTISPDARRDLTEFNIDFEENGHTDKAKEGDFAVVSPGVPTETPIVQHYLENGKEVFSELEVASWFNQSPIVGVTGSNGKTTVTNWLSHIWETAGRPAVTAGNIGHALSSCVEKTAPDKEAILEISSFQLDHIRCFHPSISVMLNITPDHLDRYQNSFKKYCDAKFRLVENQTSEDWLIYNWDDPTIRDRVQSMRKHENFPATLAFSTENKPDRGIFIRNNSITFNLNDKEEVLMSKDDIGLEGNHNLKNGLAAALSARAAEIHNEAIRESLKKFEGVEHRLEEVREIDGVRYINDSKATNVNALWYALDSFEEPIILVMGGRDKGNDYSEIIDLLRNRVRMIVAIGESQSKIERELSNIVLKFSKAETLEEAVRQASDMANPGEIVLLSPACASFDMFENYEERGNTFKEAVNKL